MKIVITGASGMVGKGVLLECLDSTFVEQVLTVNRRSIEVDHPKHKEIIVADFFDLENAKTKMKGYGACFFCAGVSSLRMKEAEYTRLTYDLTTHFAQTFIAQNPNSLFTYVSGTGTDSSEKGRSMWARIKGKTENAILNMGFKDALMFRPGYIQPMRGIRSKTNWYQWIYMVFKPIYAILKYFPSTATSTVNIGQAMLSVLQKGSDQKIFNNKDINALAKK